MPGSTTERTRPVPTRIAIAACAAIALMLFTTFPTEADDKTLTGS